MSRIADVLGAVEAVLYVYVDKESDDVGEAWIVIHKDKEASFEAVYSAQRRLHQEGFCLDFHTIPRKYIDVDEFGGPGRIRIHPNQ